MSRRVSRKISQPEENGNLTIPPCFPHTFHDSTTLSSVVDWTTLPNDTIIHLFFLLGHRDRASLSSVCRSFRRLGSSPSLWTSLDLRPHPSFSTFSASSISYKLSSLRRLCFRGPESATAVIALNARSLRDISGDCCRNITDAALTAIASRYENLESLQIGPEHCGRITSEGIRLVAVCCPRLRRLRLSGIREIDWRAINSFATNCFQLEEIGFLECGSVDERAIEQFGFPTLKFLSVAGSRNVKWWTASILWSSLPNLAGLDVSRTDISSIALSRLLSWSKGLKVVCALNCIAVEEEKNRNPTAFCNTKGKMLLANFTDMVKVIAALFENSSSDIKNWVEWILSNSLHRVAETSPFGMDEFWLKQGAALLVSLVKSLQEDVQERAATGIATFLVIDNDNTTVHSGRAETVMKEGGVPLLLDLARSCREGAQAEAAKAIANLAVNAKVAKIVADEGGIHVLSGLARSKNRWVAEEAAGGLWNLSVGEEYKEVIMEAGGVKALVDLISKSPSGMDGILERATGALANLAANDKCSMEIAAEGGVRAVILLAQSCTVVGVQEQAARALANLAAHADSNSNNAAVGEEAGAIDALVKLTSSPSEGVRKEAAGALWNLSFDGRNREVIAAAGGVEALVALVKDCSNASYGLQERAAGAVWGLSASEANCIAIGREGGVAPLIALARSVDEDVHETAAGALWNLAFDSGNARCIVEEGGVPVLVHICSSSGSKLASLMAALTLAYIFDGRMDEVAAAGPSSEVTLKSINACRRVALKHIEAFVMTFSDPQTFSAAAASSAPASLTQVIEEICIQEAGNLRCSAAEIGRFVAMLRNPCPILRGCASFALLQFTNPGGRHSAHHARLLHRDGAARMLRAAAAALTAPINYKIFARIVLRNLEHHQLELHSKTE